jgi:hypothetical protein
VTEAFLVGIFIGIIMGACIVGLVGVLALYKEKLYW